MSSDIPDSLAKNIEHWTKNNRDHLDPSANPAHWAKDELSCGTAYFSARLAKKGARPVGVDPTPAQLATARRMQQATGIVFPLIEAPAERVPLPDALFDLAFSEYGASLWADPKFWVAEAARLLRPGGRLV